MIELFKMWNVSLNNQRIHCSGVKWFEVSNIRTDEMREEIASNCILHTAGYESFTVGLGKIPVMTMTRLNRISNSNKYCRWKD